MRNYVIIDRGPRRVTIRAQGQWTIAEARAYQADMTAVLDWASITGAPISLFADLAGLIVHTADVSHHIEQAVVTMRSFPLDRYALIAPSYLMRMQCRRLLAGIDHRFFDDQADALAWLGWPGPPAPLH